MLTKSQIEKEFGRGNLPQKAVIQQRRHAARSRAEEIDKAAVTAGRDFTPEEQTEYTALLEVLHTANTLLDRHEELATFNGTPRPSSHNEFRIPVPPGAGQDNGHAALTDQDIRASLDSIRGWMSSGRIVASDTPLQIQESPVNLGLAGAIETHVSTALRSYMAVDSFQLAGSTVYQTPDTTPLIKPIISAGPDAESFVEGQTSTDSHPFQMDDFVFGGAKYSRLVKVSQESLMNSALDLSTEIISELAAGVATSFTHKITADFLAALLGNSAVFVDNAQDPYGALSGLISAVPPRYADSSNAFMGSRASLLRVQNSRDSQGRPMFDRVSGEVLGHKWVNNDGFSRVAYGDFSSGVFVRKSGYYLQRLIEAYADKGMIGFRATQWLDSKFLASVHGVTVQPVFFTNLEAEGS